MKSFLDSIAVPTIQQEDLDILDAPISLQEVIRTIKSLPGSKSPGPDGLSSKFYQLLTGKVSPHLLKLFQSIDQSLSFTQPLLEAMITVIPKPDKPKDNVGSYRPISLINVDIKIYAKILANRLNPILPKVIHPEQAGFIRGHNAKTEDTIQHPGHCMPHRNTTTPYHKYQNIPNNVAANVKSNRFLLEKQASELVHLDHLLMAEEIHRIWEFYDCYKVLSKGNLKENLTNLIEGSHNKDKPDIKQKLCSGQNDMCWEWAKLQEDLVIMHNTAHQTLQQKHQEEVKTLCLDAGAVIPGNYLYRDTEGAIVQLARDMQTVYVCDAQEASSVEAPVRSDDKDIQDMLLRTIAGKLVRQELLMQIRTYTLLDAYNKLQVDNCVGEVQKILKNIQSCSGKAAAEETAKAMEQRQIEKLVAFFKKSHNEEEMQGVQLSLSDMKQQIKEEHYTLTEQLLQVKDKILLQELMKSGSRNMDHVVCCVLSQTHLRQMVVLLQQAFKAQTHNKETWSHGTRLYEDTMGHCQEDILNLLKNKSEAIESLLDLHHIVQKMQLREHQLEEIASGLKEYCCDKVHILSCVEEALYLATELRTFREQKLKKLREDLNYICEASKKPKSLSLVPNEEKATEDTTFIKDCQEKQAELEQVYRKQMSEERLKLQDQLERGELSGLLKQKLIKEHDETVAFLEKTLQRDLDKLSIKLEEEQKRKKTFLKNLSISSTSGRLSAQSSAEQDILTLLTENIRVLQQAEQVTALRITYLSSQPFSGNFPDQETAKIVESSPILNLLKDVDSQLRANATNAKILQEKSSREIDKGNKFRDLMDLQLTKKGELTVVHLAELTAREFVVYQYGIYILQLLTSHNYTPEINLHIASCIPESSYRGNGFRNSFFYQNSERCLFVSREYLQSDGSFILLLVHCISHIVVQDLRDDTNPTFLRTFYQALKICLSDGFFSSISQDATTSLHLQDLFLNRESFLTKQSDLNSHLLRLKMNSDPLKKAREMLSQHNIELLLQNKLSMKKRKSFMLSFMGNSRHVNNEPGTKLHFKDCVSIEDLEEELDQLNSELANILEKEMESQIDYNDEGIYSLQMMSLEKECLRTKIQYLEDKITEQNMV
ncbi:uncharacterized protein LOC128638168 [Bombina bombina]|uniref:uncharacterized protein LOC128638168 n=1 Tax=Bombina bombina TaxID=8345 RepID=UPI00235A5E77|nr:uncharacterized protein LOC128638168 [Bombina bombina]